MILAEIERNREDSSKEWYPGKYVGLPEPGRGEWYFGRRLGIKKKNSSELEPTVANMTPLVWRNVTQLSEDLEQTQHIEGVNAVLELCCTTIDDDITLVMAAMNAVIRLGTGRLDRAIRFGECGACKYVTQLLHWFIYSDIETSLFSSSTPEELASFALLIEKCVTTILGAVEVLAAGCKPNRELFGKLGACSYVMEAFRRYGNNGQNFYFTELIFNCVWQLSFGIPYNRSRLREAGAENFLWQITNTPTATPAQRSRGQAVLGWLKSQLAEDLRHLQEPREIVGGLLLSISEITNSSVKGSPTEAVKLASESFLAAMRLCLRADGDGDRILEILDNFTNAIQLPEKIVQVTRRILRHHKKIFKDDIEKLCKFIIASCEAISCLLSHSFRLEKNKLIDLEAKQHHSAAAEDLERGKRSKRKMAASGEEGDEEGDGDRERDEESEGDEGDDDHVSEEYVQIKAATAVARDTSSSGSALVQLNRIKREKVLVESISKQIQEAGACRMLVKELELYVDPSSSHYDNTPAKHTHIALKSTCPSPLLFFLLSNPSLLSSPTALLDLDPLSLLSAGTGTLTRGVVAGFQGVKTGISLIGDKVQSTLSKSGEAFPDTPEGHCITAVCSSIRILGEVSLSIRLNLLVENLNTTCKWLSRGPYGVGIKSLQAWFLSQLQNDLMQKWDLPEARRPCDDDFLDSSSDSDEDSGLKNSAVAPVEEDEEVDNGEVTLTIALQVIDRFGGRQSNPSLPMDDLMKTLFRDAIDYIGRFVSERGMQGECLFAKQEGYEILFRPMNKHMITDFKIFDAWITTITSIGLARIESKMSLSEHGACEICLDGIRTHILRPRIVEKCLWCLCVLAANNSYSMAKIIGWHSETWNSESAKVLLSNLQKNKGQTNETREHAALILSWMNLRQTISSSPTSAAAAAIGPPAAVSTAIGSRGESTEEEKGTTSLRNRRDSDLSSTMSPRSSLHLATDSGAISGAGAGVGAGSKPGIGNSDIFFRFSIHGHSKTGTVHQYGITEI